MSRLTRDGTAEPVSRDQFLRHARGQGNIIFPVQLTTSRIGNLTRLIHTLLYVMTYIRTYNGQKRELPVLFSQKRMHPENNSGRECCWPYLIGQHPLSPVFGQKRPGTPGNSYFAQLPSAFGHFMFLSGGLYSSARTDQHGSQGLWYCSSGNRMGDYTR